MFKNVSKLKSLSNLIIKFHSIGHTISSTSLTSSSSDYLEKKLLKNLKLPLTINNLVTNGTTNVQQITYFSRLPNRNTNKGRGRRSTNDRNKKFDPRIPKLVYLHNPFKYFKTKLKLLKLKLRWDRTFNQKEFIRGTKQAAVVLTNVIRTQNFEQLSSYTTRVGFHQITRDMILSKTDPRLQIIQFRSNDLRRAIPVKVMLFEHQGNRHCLIDMFFVGMRNANDFKSRADHDSMSELIKKFDIINKQPGDLTIPLSNANNHIKRIIFAEIFVRFYRDYTDRNFVDNWNVSFYKILNFDILQIRDTKK